MFAITFQYLVQNLLQRWYFAFVEWVNFGLLLQQVWSLQQKSNTWL